MNKVNKYTFRPYVVFIVFLGLLLLPGTFCFLYICLFHTNTLNIYGKIAAYLMCIGMICVDVYMVLACRCKVKLSVEGIEIFNAGKCKYYTAKWIEFGQISFVHDWSGHMHMCFIIFSVGMICRTWYEMKMQSSLFRKQKDSAFKVTKTLNFFFLSWFFSLYLTCCF